MNRIDNDVRGAFSASRRAILAGGAAAIAASALPRRAYTAAPPRAGIQLYTVRSEMQKDVPGSLKKIAHIGYKELEFAGYFDHKPAEIRKMVADLGMTAPSSHVQSAAVRATPKQVIDDAREGGHEFVVLAWLPPEDRQTIDQWKAIADFCSQFGAQCKEAGLRFAYHNHDFEFKAIGGVVPYDVMLRHTDPSVVQFELDMYWAVESGGDLVKILSSNRGRIPLCHVKDILPSGAMTDVGLGTIDFKGIFARPEITPMEHYFVENDDTKTPFESAAVSYKALSAILADLPKR